MLWQIEINPRPGLPDPHAVRVLADARDLGVSGLREVRVAQLYLLETDLPADRVATLATRLLYDPVVQEFRAVAIAPGADRGGGAGSVTIFRRPGVMDPVEGSLLKGARDLELPVKACRTGWRYDLVGEVSDVDRDRLVRKALANEVVDEVYLGGAGPDRIPSGSPYVFRLVTIPLRGKSDETLEDISRAMGLSLTLAEMRVIRDHFEKAGRDPKDAELESLAQTWSEHCKHKTLTGIVNYREGNGKPERFDNLLKQTVFRATQELDKPWCLSVFRDNAGVVAFDEKWAICVKVETHNHPSAIEPYGGAGTGVGGVIRDCIGCGLGAKPILNTDVFCVGPPDLAEGKVPRGALHPKRVLKGVVAGVRDYGNRMGIPTSNGAVLFDERYVGNPLVFCGTVGIMPRDKVEKAARTGDLIVLVGGRTGRDGIHGATFSSVPLTEQSERVSGGAVQIGNAIVEKRVLDAVLGARDAELYTSITDCGAGGLSSAVGEMGESIGAEVHLDRVPLKYEGLTYSEVWISEAQERMVLSVPPDKERALLEIFQREGVDATGIGTFTGDKRLRLYWQKNQVADLEMGFLHNGLPRVIREASWQPPAIEDVPFEPPLTAGEAVKKLLSQWNTASKEWIIRQYDHEVQGMSVAKPLVGAANDGPGDACVLRPVRGSTRGIAVGCGINPRYGDLDPYAMASAAIDEAVRNVVAVGGDPTQTTILDNFSWANPTKPEQLGGLVRAAKACYDVARSFGTPFVSGKDSLYNEFAAEGTTVAIPGTLLVTAVAIVPDVTKCVTMDLKAPGNHLYLVGVTHPELGGSAYHALLGKPGGKPPKPNLSVAPSQLVAVSQAIRSGWVRACHDLSEGGLGVALAEMAFAGGVGVEVDLFLVPWEGEGLRDDRVLFSETCTRFLLEVSPRDVRAFESGMAGTTVGRIGRTIADPVIRLRGIQGRPILDEPLSALKEAWQAPLRW